MKNLAISLIIGFIIFSCTEKRNSENQDNSCLNFSVDTVMVDPGEEILYLKDNLWLSDISLDERSLFNFNRNDAVLEKIDLDNLTLIKKIKYEKEGPNGIGPFISNFTVTAEENILMWFYGLTSIFDQNAFLIRNLNFEHIAGDEINQSGALPIEIFEDPNDPNRFFGFYVLWEEMSYFLLDVDVLKETYRKIELPELNKINEFSSEILFNGQKMGSMGTTANAIANGNRIIITNNSFNDVYIYDASVDSLYLRSLEGPLVGSKKSYIPPKQIDGESDQRWDVNKKIDEDIFYGEVLWDSKNQRFLRLSYKQRFGEEKEEYGAFKSIGADVFLSAFDIDFTLIGESLVPILNKTPRKHFVKGGKIWIFENIDDEMGFIRLSLE